MKNHKKREKYLGMFGPLSLLMLLSFWTAGLIFGYAVVEWAIGAQLNLSTAETSFATYLYLSGVTFFTLGYGDVAPIFPLGRAIDVIDR